MADTMVRRRRLRIAGFEIALGVEERQARRIRRLAAPVLRLFGRAAQSSAPLDLPGTRATLDPSAYVSPPARAIAERVQGVDWYHVIELPHGVVTPGYVDHRAIRDRYCLPADMHGMRVLEVATFDGFWAFEMERRGAVVVATDIPSWFHADIPLRTLERMAPDEDTPTGAGFRLAHELLGSRVERRTVSVYDLSPHDLGTFDMVFVSDLMLHLRDPQRALERIYPMLKPGGFLLLAEPYNPELEGLGNTAMTQFFGFYQYIWSVPSTMTLRTMLQVAGFDTVEEVARLPLVYHHPFPVEKVIFRARRSSDDTAAPAHARTTEVSAR